MTQLKYSLTIEQFGALTVLIDHTFELQEWLDVESGALKNRLGVSRRKVDTLLGVLEDKQLIIRNSGKIIIPCMQEEFEEIKNRQRQARERSLKNAQISVEKREKVNEINESDELQYQLQDKKEEDSKYIKFEPGQYEELHDQFSELESSIHTITGDETEDERSNLIGLAARVLQSVHQISASQAKSNVARVLRQMDGKLKPALETICNTGQSEIQRRRLVPNRPDASALRTTVSAKWVGKNDAVIGSIQTNDPTVLGQVIGLDRLKYSIPSAQDSVDAEENDKTVQLKNSTEYIEGDIVDDLGRSKRERRPAKG